jgi:hypothetical protein
MIDVSCERCYATSSIVPNEHLGIEPPWFGCVREAPLTPGMQESLSVLASPNAGVGKRRLCSLRDGKEGLNQVRVPNDPGEQKGPFAEFLRLQTEFYTRLADETTRYFRRLQAAGAPAAPGTVLLADGPVDLQASGPPGSSVELRLELENRQRVHCMVMPLLSPLVEASGTTWFPAAEPLLSSLLLAPEEVAPLVLRVALPAHLPGGLYRGALLLQGFRQGSIPVAVTVTAESDRQEEGGAKTGSASVSPAEPRASRHRAKKRGHAPARQR